jgi:signal recognition particle subunit SRP54
VTFIGTGEKPHDLEHFNPEAFLSRLLGMGDLETLMEKIKSVTDEKDLKKTQERLKEGKLTLRDVQSQLESMESLGSMDKILGMGSERSMGIDHVAVLCRLFTLAVVQRMGR